MPRAKATTKGREVSGYLRCAAITKGGERCKGVATGGATHCYAHDPARAEERSRNARRAGRVGGNGRPGGLSETAEAKRYIRGLVAKLLKGELARETATACFMGLNVLARYIELERKIREQEELVERLESLEEVLEHQKETRRRGA
jgi:hypothetical protein